MLAEVLMVPDRVVAVKETSPVALIANVPAHAIEKWKVLPEYLLSE